MSAARTIIGNYCYKKSIGYILNKCKMHDIRDLLDITTLKYIHKVITNQTPNAILRYYKMNNNRENSTIISTI